MTAHRRGLAAAVAAVIAAAAWMSASATADSAAERAHHPDSWSVAAEEFKIRLHTIASEALILELKTPSFETPRNQKAARRIRWDAQGRLSDSLRSTNALLSMLEIAEHSDRGARVREIIRLWLDSSRKSLADHLKAVQTVSPETPLDGATAAFLEELKILWRRVDGAYAELETALELRPAPAAAPAVSAAD